MSSSSSSSSPDAKILTLDGLMTEEKLRGMVVSVFSGSCAVGLNLVGVTALGLSAPVSAALFLHGFGSILSFCLDIVVAKAAFGSPAKRVPYTDVGRRLRWLARSFVHKPFYRFIVTVIIETLTCLAILVALVRWLDDHRILQAHSALRNGLIAVLVSVTVFLLFGNIIRFDWAYNELDHPVLNVVVMAWMAMTMLIFARGAASDPSHGQGQGSGGVEAGGQGAGTHAWQTAPTP